MTRVRVKGFKVYRVRGRWYCYHRATGTRVDLVKHPLGSAGFFAACQRITDAMQPEPAPMPGTLGELVPRFKASLQWTVRLGGRAWAHAG